MWDDLAKALSEQAGEKVNIGDTLVTKEAGLVRPLVSEEGGYVIGYVELDHIDEILCQHGEEAVVEFAKVIWDFVVDLDEQGLFGKYPTPIARLRKYPITFGREPRPGAKIRAELGDS